MNLGRDVIIKNISTDTLISKTQSKKLLEIFLKYIKYNVSKNKIKISSFGTFSSKISPQRIGRNPKTLEEFIIFEKKKIKYIPSNKIKTRLN